MQLRNNTDDSMRKWHRLALLEGIMNNKEQFYHSSTSAQDYRAEMQKLHAELENYKHPNEEFWVEMIAV